MENEKPRKGEEEPQEAIDWENRILCSDGNCIGVIGPDGLCKECGKKHDGPLPENIAFEEDTDTPQEEEKQEAVDAPDDQSWENRTLCSDGNCIGVLGPDGRCKECGKPGDS